MRILKRPMFKKGGSANEGIMHGLERRNYAQSNWEDLSEIYKNLPIEIRKYDSPVVHDAASEDLDQGALLDYGWATGPKYEGPEWHEDIYIDEEGKLQKRELPEMIDTPPGGTQLPSYEMPTPKKIDPGLGGAQNYDVGSFEDRKANISNRAREFMDLLSPEAQKRALIDAGTAASKAFGQSTGDTKQDIANAITAAAEATGTTQDIALAARKLAIEEDIALKSLEKTAEFKAKYKDYADAEKVKAIKYLTSKAGGSMKLEDAKNLVYGKAGNVAEAINNAVKASPSGTLTATTVYTGAIDFYGPENVKKVTEEEWTEHKDTLDDGIYVIGKKIYQISDKKPKLIVDYTTET